MKLTISILYFFAFSLIIFESGESTIGYGPLIENVYDEYGTIGIIMATDKNHFSLERMTTLQNISRKISTRGIGSVVVNFGRLKDTVKFHHKPPAHPLVVIFLDGITKVREFREEIITMDMSYPVWLVLFTGDNDEDSCEYCRYPTGNPFNLKLDTEMLVSCCNSSYVAKWSPEKMNYTDTLARDGAIKKIHEIARHHKGTLYNRQQLLDIKELRVVIDKNSRDIWKEGNELHGYLGEIVTELSRVMNFSISCVMEESSYGNFDPETSTWSGAIGAVTQGKADIGALKVGITLERSRVVDFTPSLGTGQLALYYQRPHRRLIQWTGFLKVFHPNVWIAIVIFLLITPILLTTIQYTRKDNLLDVLCRNYVNVWGLFCQQGSSDSLHGAPLRIIYLAILVLSIIVYAAYSAALINHLTSPSDHALFHNIYDFVEAETHELIVIKDGAAHNWLAKYNSLLIENLRKLLKPKDSLPITHEEAFEQICKGKLVFFDYQAGDYLRENNVPCEILSVSLGRTTQMGMILALNGEYTKLVKYHIQRFQRNGMVDRIKRKYSKKRKQTGISYKPVTFRDVVPILTSFAVGCSIAIVIFRIEKSSYDRMTQ